MSVSPPPPRLELPEPLRHKLSAFRGSLWAVKLAEAGFGAASGLLLAYLITYALDRLTDTPGGVRLGIFSAAMLGCGLIPLAVHRWVWGHRRMEQLARLLSRRYPSVGDQLLGIIELVRNEAEQRRSRVLCEAAVRQVSEQALARDFTAAVPNPRHRRFGALAALAGAAAVVLLGLYPAAAANAWSRFLMPWLDTPRYTFAMLDGVPDSLVVAHGEPFSLSVKLAEQTVSRPEQGVARIGAQPAVAAHLRDNGYAFDLPPQIEPGGIDLTVGDFAKRVRVEPTLRPELRAVTAEVTFPAYLGRTAPLKKDVRGGSIALVDGSAAAFAATASRDLSSATVNGRPAETRGPDVVWSVPAVKGTDRLDVRWQDRHGLGGKDAFALNIIGLQDQPPSVACQGLPTRRVVLDTEQLTFNVTAQDDYGVKRVGMEWRGLDKVTLKTPAAGERLIAAGGPEKELLDHTGTFSAAALGIEPQPVQVRLFVEDYFPGRERVYSPAYILYVLNAEQHAVWVAEQLSKWHRQSLEVRDRELQLFEVNKELRQLSPDALNDPDTRRRIDTQSEAERANGRRLAGLVTSGEELLKQAMRNPEIGVGHLEKWAQMLQILKDISGNRMPSVADLLKQAARSPGMAQKSPPSPSAGQVRASGSGQPPPPGQAQTSMKVPIPSVNDVESTLQPPDKTEKPAAAGGKPSAPRLTLPVTTLTGGKPGEACPAGAKVDEAVTKQEELLAEFEKIADELNRVLANLEGGSLVKRLKAASRLQAKVARRLNDHLSDTFGRASKPEPEGKLLKDLAAEEDKSSHDLSNIMDDTQSYFERRRLIQFKTVLDDMRKQDVVDGLRRLGEDLPRQTGLSLAQCEYWSDTMDRWAEDLVDPAKGGA